MEENTDFRFVQVDEEKDARHQRDIMVNDV